MVVASTIPDEALEAFQTGLRGTMLRPGDSGYDDARRVWNGMIDKHPDLIVRCAGTADVIAAVRFAREHDLLVAVRGGGHNVAGTAVCDGGMVIDLSPMRGITVDPVGRSARAQGGVLWKELDHETQAFGLATTGGTVSTTGIGGLTLGGGLGWLMGAYGLSCDNLLSVDIVLADGTFVTASETSHPDLFWAVRGGGGNFGIVTQFEFRLHQVGPIVCGGMILFPLHEAVQVLRAFRDFVTTMPDDLSLFAGLLSSPEGHPAVAVVGCYAGSVEDGQREMAPLRSFGTPALDAIGPIPYVVHQSLLDASAPAGRQIYWKSHFFRELTDEALDTLVSQFATVPSPFSLALIEHIHGAASRVPAGATAFGHRNSPFNLAIVSMWEDPAQTDTQVAWTRACMATMQPFLSDAVYVNYLTAEDGNVAAAYPGDYQRLVAVKTTYDPTNFFRGNQNIVPTA